MTRSSALTYIVHEDNLTALLALALEIHAETGLCPAEIRLPDGSRVSFSHADARAVCRLLLTASEYVDKHGVSD
ncbi:MAG: hypothetical protein LBN29_11350 [Mediterranea sp.]|jgi:hypothetical protein|nr:hypothetical protein [Mediterranea sp.]